MVTAQWDNSAAGDNNANVALVTIDFSQFGGGAPAAMETTPGSNIWQASYTIAAGTIAAAGRNVSVTAADNAGNPTTTADTSDLWVDATLPHVPAWASAADHGHGVGEAVLPIADDGSFSEPRDSGVRRLLITFDEAIDPASFSPASIQLAGNDATGASLNLSGITWTTSLRDGNTVGEIEFSAALPDDARYLVRIIDVTDAAGNLLDGDNDRIMTALKGDASGDLRVNATDLSRVRGSATDPVSAADVNQVPRRRNDRRPRQRYGSVAGTRLRRSRRPRHSRSGDFDHNRDRGNRDRSSFWSPRRWPMILAQQSRNQPRVS